jgi:hypothetical protein
MGFAIPEGEIPDDGMAMRKPCYINTPAKVWV